MFSWQRRWALAALLYCLLGAPCALASEPMPDITLSGSADVKNSYLGRWLQLIYTDAFARLGYNFKYLAFPMRRSGAASSSGLSDGEINRLYDYDTFEPSLVRVEEPHFITRYVAYAARPGLRVTGWPSLAGKGWMVGYLAGTRRPEKILTSILPKEELTATMNLDAGMHMLYLKRIDLLIYSEPLVQDWLRRHEDPSIDTSVFYIAGELEPATYHVFLARKYADLSPKLSDILRKMKKDGLIEQYRLQALTAP